MNIPKNTIGLWHESEAAARLYAEMFPVCAVGAGTGGVFPGKLPHVPTAVMPAGAR